MKIVALGTHVVLKSIAKSAGTEIVSKETGLIMGIRQVGETPTQCEIFAIGPNVPKGLFEIGDITPVPLDGKIHVPHPDVIAGICEAKERDDKYTSVDYRHISCIYKG